MPSTAGTTPAPVRNSVYRSLTSKSGGKALAFLPFNLSESVLIGVCECPIGGAEDCQSWCETGQSVAAEAGLFIAENQDRTPDGKSTVARGGDAPA
jgi:hypothetical protein